MRKELTVKANVMVCKDDGPVAFRGSSQSDVENTMKGFDVVLLGTEQKKGPRSAKRKGIVFEPCRGHVRTQAG